jgi:hypothetical protein
MAAAGSLFLVLYGITAVYFSDVMVRLMLVLGTAKLRPCTYLRQICHPKLTPFL